MYEKRIIEGNWWILGEHEPALFGTLTFDPAKELTLVAKKPTNLSFTEVLSDSVSAQSASLPPVLHGQDEDGRLISLFGCGIDNHTVASGMETFEISALAGLLGEKFSDWRSAKFLTAEVHFTLLHEWLDESTIEQTATSDGRRAVTLRPSREAWLYDLPGGDKLRFDRDVGITQSPSKYTWNLGHRAWFHFPSEQTVSAITEDRINRMRQLLSLLVGERVYVDRVSLFHSDPFVPGGEPGGEIELLRPNHGIRGAVREVRARRMIAPFSEVETTFQQVLTRWFIRYPQLEPVIDLYFAVLFNKLPVTTQFLQLAQALEAYHSRSGRFKSSDLPTAEHRQRVSKVIESAPSEHHDWMKNALEHANKKTLAQRLDDVFHLHSAEANKLFSSIPDVAARIRHTRNYFTHYDEKTRDKIFSDRELSQVTFWMLPFLQICLLKELEIPGAPITRILHRYGDVQFLDLESIPECTPQASDKEERPAI